MISELLSQGRDYGSFYRLKGRGENWFARFFELGKKFWNPRRKRVRLQHNARTNFNSNDKQQSDQA